MRTLQVFVFTILAIAGSVSAHAQVLFSDNFNNGASQLWSNQSGGWSAANGVYQASAPSNSPMSYSGVTSLQNLTDFTVSVDVNNWRDGGIYLRSSDVDGSISGVLLVTGGYGQSYSGLYWHTIQNNSFSGPLNQAEIAGLRDSNAQLTIKVVGDTYEAYVNGALASTLNTSLFKSGGVAVYQYYSAQTLDNFQVAAVPEPETYAMLLAGLGLVGVVARRRKQK